MSIYKDILQRVSENPGSENKEQFIKLVREVVPLFLECSSISSEGYENMYSNQKIKEFLESKDLKYTLEFIKEFLADLLSYKKWYLDMLHENVSSYAL